MDYLKKELGKNIKLARKSSNLSQEQLAELIGIDIRQMTRIETGRSFATAETLEKISFYTKTPIKFLFDIEENNIKTLNVNDNKFINYLDNYKKLNDIVKEFAHDDYKTEFLTIASRALGDKMAREKLKGYILGLAYK